MVKVTIELDTDVKKDNDILKRIFEFNKTINPIEPKEIFNLKSHIGHPGIGKSIPKPDNGKKFKSITCNPKYNMWNDEQEDMVRKHYRTMDINKLRRMINEMGPARTIPTIRFKASQIGVTGNKRGPKPKDEKKIDKTSENLGIYKPKDLEDINPDIQMVECPICNLHKVKPGDICEYCDMNFEENNVKR